MINLTLNRWHGLVLLACLSGATAAAAQTTVPAPTTPDRPDASPSRENSPTGLGSGVVQPPRGVDPAMVTPPPQPSAPTMPVIKPPAPAR